MTQYSYIYATGDFRSNLNKVLDYPSSFYVNTTEGAPIITSVIELFNREQWTIIAKAFGITEPENFNQHHIHPENINYNELHESLQAIGYSHEEANRFVERLKILISSEFEFLFCLANGEDN